MLNEEVEKFIEQIEEAVSIRNTPRLLRSTSFKKRRSMQRLHFAERLK